MTSSTISNPSHLEPSQLGTKEYWDNLYTTEMANHAQDPSDEGTVWFDDSGAEAKMLSFLRRKVVKEKLLLGEEVTESNCSFLDLGTGNGHLLFALRGDGVGDSDGDGGSIDSEGESEPERSGGGGRELEGGGDGEGEALEGWGGRMLGVDYSARSVEFAKRIARDKGYGEGSEPRKEVEFLKWDIMSEDPSPGVLSGEQARGWDVVLDKGTFDAISLSEGRDECGRRVCEGYCGRVVPLIREGGVLLVTSCNWTEEELERWFVGPGAGGGGGGGQLEVLDRIEYRSFSFGGKKGQTISSVCFRKRGRL
ncbi:S-adenosylmethionine-dependent methyltransferase [Drepanopeziza brunnea f. sp. 'multigermtubi' MB_m1]|uniref:Protein-lysine N-methyltransferase EFM4 n=1 Tax=Marssonina brunnea f. sp. multigermtubi (strain MB_m1) TaxID=1072389 RepID=K1X4V2_MARBU|nr:S-adenosylmethionine-dependent methyltransferase [Drepanopeziza brunnea f. sp. 'multigermtubi' MB_m1]EKD20196.1 S-adenosylmethionine-dependent methyltransferase [Drepanopeziza brunnea f. sp. 'multigermtubi' MB_m1]